MSATLGGDRPARGPAIEGRNAFTLGWVGDDTGNVNVDHVRLRASLGVLPDAYAADVTAPKDTVQARPDPAGAWSDRAVDVALEDQPPGQATQVPGAGGARPAVVRLR